MDTDTTSESEQAKPDGQAGQVKARGKPGRKPGGAPSGNDPIRRKAVGQLPWANIEAAYIAGVGLRELARRTGIPQGTIAARASRGQWTRKELHKRMVGDLPDIRKGDGGIVLAESVPVDVVGLREELIPGILEAMNAPEPDAGTGDAGTTNPGDRDSGIESGPGNRDSGIVPQQGIRDSGIQTDRSVLVETDRSVGNSRSGEISQAANLADATDAHILRLATQLLSQAAIAKPKSVGELNVLHQIVHRAANGWRKSAGGDGPTMRRCARVPAVIEAEIVRESAD